MKSFFNYNLYNFFFLFLLFLLKICIKFLILLIVIYLNIIFLISNINDELTFFIIWKKIYFIINLFDNSSIINFFFVNPFLYSIKIDYLLATYNNILSDYYNILYFISISTLISLIFFSVSYFFFVRQIKYNEKLLPYECGFDPFNDARKQFDVNFYLIAIFFIIFDIEAIFIFPWVVSFYQLTDLGFLNMIDFIFELLIGYFYLIFVDALDWL